MGGPEARSRERAVHLILEGALKFVAGGADRQGVVVRAGEVLHLPAHVPHALEDTLDVDVFYPPRQDWLSQTDSYLRDAQRSAPSEASRGGDQ